MPPGQTCLRAAAVGALTLLGAVPAVAAAEPGPMVPAEEIVERMIAAYGGMERWNAVRTVSFDVRDIAYGVGGKPIVAETENYFRKDPRWTIRIDSHHGDDLHTKVFDGLEAWMAVDGALLQRGQGTYRRIRDSARTSMLWVSFPFSLVDPGTRVEHIDDTRFMGIDTYVLQVSFAPERAVHEDDVYHFYVNKLTYLLVREEYFLHGESENRVETIYGDYRSVRGLVKDHLREIVASVNGQTLQRIEIGNLRFGVDLPAELFQKPSEPMEVAAPVE